MLACYNYFVLCHSDWSSLSLDVAYFNADWHHGFMHFTQLKKKMPNGL